MRFHHNSGRTIDYSGTATANNIITLHSALPYHQAPRPSAIPTHLATFLEGNG
jgi:hypothetical protein